ncbi:MAG: ATP-binding protein [Bacteroidia bacterium]|nr:ATP-binding protein [Bacteroidia bacterium]
MIASGYDTRIREQDNVAHDPIFGLRILKSAVVYGANASGKSKLIEAMAFMKRFVLSGLKDSQKGDEIQMEPFRLDTQTEHAPSVFEVVFLHENTMYRYGFEADRRRVVSEWLYSKKRKKEIELFYRTYQDFDIHPREYPKGKMLKQQELVRDNTLMLSVAAQFNDPVSIQVLDWFSRLGILSALHETHYGGTAIHRTADPATKRKILNLLLAADIQVEDFYLKPSEHAPGYPYSLGEEKRREHAGSAPQDPDTHPDVWFTYKKYGEKQAAEGHAEFSLMHDESAGTQKYFFLAGPMLDAIERGSVLMIDEFDSQLHPNLAGRIVELFNSARHNPHHAQLICNTHNTNLLDSSVLRRDQIWFTEKSKYGDARLYSLADFKTDKVRKQESFEKNYIRGKYGAVPYLALADD